MFQRYFYLQHLYFFFLAEITDSKKQEVDSFIHSKCIKCLHMPSIFLGTDDTEGIKFQSSLHLYFKWERNTEGKGLDTDRWNRVCFVHLLIRDNLEAKESYQIQTAVSMTKVILLIRKKCFSTFLVIRHISSWLNFLKLFCLNSILPFINGLTKKLSENFFSALLKYQKATIFILNFQPWFKR